METKADNLQSRIRATIAGLNQDRLFDRLSQILISAFACLFLILATTCQLGPTGESDDYVIATIAIERHQSLLINADDVEQAKTDFPEQYDSIYNSFTNTDPNGFFRDTEGNNYPWYMATYSISVLPTKWLFKALEIPPSRAYTVSNVLYFTAALLVVYFCLKASRKAIFLSLLLLVFSPMVLYYFWISAEMFLCALMIVAVVFFINGNHHMAALFCAIASSLNITIGAFCLVIFADYCISVWRDNRGQPVKSIAAHAWKKTVLLGVCFSPALITPLYNLTHFGIINLQNTLGFARTDLLFERLLAYLFDLNLGFLAYYPLLLTLFFATLVLGIAKKQRLIVMLSVAFFLTMTLYSATWHINCGMTEIARYNAWLSPIMILAVATQIGSLIHGRILRPALYLTLSCSVLITFGLSYSSWTYNRGHWKEFTPLAHSVLDAMPALYDPYPFTFILRTRQIDNGYVLTDRPTIYANDDNNIRKILIPANTASQVLDSVMGSPEALVWLEEELQDVATRNDRFAYINYTGSDLHLVPPAVFDASKQPQLARSDFGVYPWENTFSWIAPEAQITLKGDEIKQHGLDLAFSSPLTLVPLTDDSTIQTTVTVNGEVMRTVELETGESYEISIPTDELPDTDDGLYEIRLSTNGCYNPQIQGDSTDDRDLALALIYAGAPYYPAVFDASKQPQLARSDFGVYPWENTFSWIAPEAQITLKGDEIKQHGLDLAFSSPLTLVPLTDDSTIQTTVTVNGEVMRTVELETGESYEISIPTDELPDTDDGLYEIRLSTNGCYNPQTEEGSADTRDLAVMLTYVGAPFYPAAFDAIKQPESARSNFGIYPWENTFNWLEPEAQITLKGDEIKQHGLDLAFSSPLTLVPLTDDSTIQTIVTVNGKVVRTVVLEAGESYEISIPANELPDTDDGLYEIRLSTNGCYNPQAQNGSGDDRDLALALTYVGAPLEAD